MSTDVPVRCGCGKLGGVALSMSRDSATRIVCFCGDCQAFARFLGGEKIMDEWGGTEIVHIMPAQLRITQNDDALRGVRLSEKGLHRWYCGHCKTPIGNTVGPRVPFIGVIDTCLDYAAAGTTREDVLGKPRGYLHSKSAIGGAPPQARGSSMLPVVGRSLRQLVRSVVTGGRSPSPFYDSKTREPAAPLRVLTPSERQAI